MAERSLLLVWPTRNDTWACDAVDGYNAVGGDHVLFVGEGPGGRTGDSGFHARVGETAGCIACAYGVADVACTCGIDAPWTRTSCTALPAGTAPKPRCTCTSRPALRSEGRRGAGGRRDR